MGKGSLCFRRTFSRHRLKKPSEPSQQAHVNSSDNSIRNGLVVAGNSGSDGAMVVGVGKGKKKIGGTRKWLWMRFDRAGQSELFECEKNAIVRRVSIPARDLRVLGPVFSHSSNILAREKAMVVNLEFIKAIVTAEEVLIFDPLGQEVVPFVDQLRLQLPPKTTSKTQEGCSADVANDEMHDSAGRRWLPAPVAAEVQESELPFEFQVLEIALEVICTYLDSNVADLERDAYPILDELAQNVSTKNLERVRSLKSNLTRLLARVQKVRDEIEHLLDDNEDMAQLYLSRKWTQIQQSEALLGSGATNSISLAVPPLRHNSSTRSGSIATSNYSNDNDVEDLEMLLEAYFMQLDGTRNKILSVREYIDDTEDYVNIQLDNQRNELIQLQLILTISSFAIAMATLIAGAFGMNIPCPLYNINGIFGFVVGGFLAVCFLLFMLVLGYARWKKLLG
ncbi:hypothetical protein SAY87_029975 [Trapa incisa]|uniref:Magnesium transporter n=1 Tax=Trapa incisa TaxID=236973 RepID=A0AAN7Q9M3_9MYRT|nr:hypothetical protein SAY87_029975 [Trapa incisa]